jgi:hypothetical protein
MQEVLGALQEHGASKCPLAGLLPKLDECNPVVANAVFASLARLDPKKEAQMRVISLIAKAWVQTVLAGALTTPDEEELVELTNGATVYQHLDKTGVRFTTTWAAGATEMTVRQIAAFLLGAVGGALGLGEDEAAQGEPRTPPRDAPMATPPRQQDEEDPPPVKRTVEKAKKKKKEGPGQ